MTADKDGYDLAGIIARSPWFEGLPERARQRLAEAANVHHYRKGGYLYTKAAAQQYDWAGVCDP
jgi:hypothetical protein